MTPPRGRKRKASNASSTLQVPTEPKRGRSASPRPSSGFATLKNAVSGLFASNTPDPTNPVLNGASIATKPKPALGDFFRGIASQSGRLGENVGLISSFIDTELFSGGYADDRKYQVSSLDLQKAEADHTLDGANPTSGSFLASGLTAAG
jgi:hypothetical protein